jgi:hypothetical protein
VLPSADASGDYLISNISEWNTFANAVSTGATFSGKTVKLANDLSGVTMKAGTYHSASSVMMSSCFRVPVFRESSKKKLN